MNYRFVREEPELYRLLFLMRSDDVGIGAYANMRHMQETGECPYSDREIGQILTGFSVSIFKAIK